MHPQRQRWRAWLHAGAIAWMSIAGRLDSIGDRIGWWDQSPNRTRILVGLHLGAVWGLLVSPGQPGVSLAVGGLAGAAAAALLLPRHLAPGRPDGTGGAPEDESPPQ